MEIHEQVVTWLNESESKFDRLLSELGDVSDITVMAEKQEQLQVKCSIWNEKKKLNSGPPKTNSQHGNPELPPMAFIVDRKWLVRKKSCFS